LKRNKNKTNEWLLNQNKVLKQTKVDSKFFIPFVCSQDYKKTLEKFFDFIDKDITKGISFVDFGLDESPKDMISQLEDITTEIEKNDYAKTLPLTISGVDHPHLILECVERGIDLFEGDYPFINAELGFATNIPTGEIKEEADLKINLRDKKYELDDKPLMSDCKCDACTQHTRAYIHHLLNTKEITGIVLLSIHNLFQYLKFFDFIHYSIENDQFLDYKNNFLKFLN
jgi:queuine tRNA-ribosyltransferase accessory subunit